MMLECKGLNFLITVTTTKKLLFGFHRGLGSWSYIHIFMHITSWSPDASA